MATRFPAPQASLSFPQPLADKWRPRTIDRFLGLDKPKRIMANFCKSPRPAAFLFSGPSGTGKTSLALATCEELQGELIHIPSQHCSVAELVSRPSENESELSERFYDW
jgi:replication-associated recombination protein RarA